MNVSDILCVAVLLFEFVFLLRLVLSFFPIQPDTTWGAVRSLSVAATEPVVMPVRRVVPPLPGAMAGFGIAELLILIALQIVARILC